MTNPNSSTSPDSSTIEELHATLAQLNSADQVFALRHALDVATGRIVPDGAGSVKITRPLVPLTADDSPMWELYNSVMGLRGTR
jgi:hypothetical protein